MANKYLIAGATYCGNGTASNEAASAGAAGAWNDINVLTGTAPAYGTAPAAGDTVYIRSKTSAGANISVTVSTSINIGSASATDDAPIQWVLDNGTIWSGINGTLTFSRTASATITLRAANVLEALEHKALIFSEAYAANNNIHFVILGIGAILINAWIDCSGVTYSSGGPASVLQHQLGAISINPVIDLSNKIYGNTIFFANYDGGLAVNPVINVPTSLNGKALIWLAQYGSRAKIFGGNIKGVGAGSSTMLVEHSIYNPSLDAVGLQYPKQLVLRAEPTTKANDSALNFFGADGGMGAIRACRWGYADSRADNNPPYLNATYPNSNSTGWAWRLYPSNAYMALPFELPVSKLYTSAAARKKVTLELLVSQTFTAANKGNVWLDLHYIDDTSGESEFLTTRDLRSTAALDSSTTTWTPSETNPTWGSITFNKRKLEITLPSGKAIKQDTMVIAVLRGFCKSVTSDDIFFVCPDVQLSAP
jgi:hypothetical protein